MDADWQREPIFCRSCYQLLGNPSRVVTKTEHFQLISLGNDKLIFIPINVDGVYYLNQFHNASLRGSSVSAQVKFLCIE